MLDLELFAYLANAITDKAILILVGDTYQLPSVSAGNVLEDLVSTRLLENVTLEKLVRQKGSAGALIAENASRIRDGRTDIVLADSFQIKRFNSPEEAYAAIPEQIDQKNSMTLCPLKKENGILNTRRINEKLQPGLGELLFEIDGVPYYEGDRIVFTRTSYRYGYTNGDIAILTDGDEDFIKYRFEGEERNHAVWSKHVFEDIELAYCLTVHKAQGGETDEVHIVLPSLDQAAPLLNRKLIYTAVTRARSKVVIYTVGTSLEAAIKNPGTKRKTMLTSLIQLALRYRNPPYRFVTDKKEVEPK